MDIFQSSSEGCLDVVQLLYGEDWPLSVRPSPPDLHGMSFYSVPVSNPMLHNNPLELIFSKLSRREHQIMVLSCYQNAEEIC